MSAVDVWAHHKRGAAWTDLRELSAELSSVRHYDPARRFGRNPAVAPKDRAAFDQWFAGFTDGEGCFGIHLNNGTYQCRFSIQMRADDAPILNQIRDTFAIGNLHYKPRTGTSEERWFFGVRSRADIEKLVEILDESPLRAKKRRDYEIWRQAVRVWSLHRTGDSWSDMAQLAVALRDGRRESLLPAASSEPPA